MALTDAVVRDERLIREYSQAIIMGMIADRTLVDSITYGNALEVLEDPTNQDRVLAIAEAMATRAKARAEGMEQGGEN